MSCCTAHAHIDTARYDAIQAWFYRYARSFFTGDTSYDRPLALKLHHCERVCSESADIAASIDLPRPQIQLARVIGLLHDIGRFRQYVVYRTFSDRHSEDHAVLGARIITREDLLASFAPCLQRIVTDAVSWHNRRILPAGQDGEVVRFARILRDADKIDILKVLTEYYDNRHITQDAAIEHGLPDTGGVSEAVVQSIWDDRTIRLEEVHNLNDFKLFQLGWVNDLNFGRSYEIIAQRGYFERLRAHLPATALMDRLYAHVVARMKECMRRRLPHDTPRDGVAVCE